MQLFWLVKNAEAEQYTSRQDSLNSAPELVRLVDETRERDESAKPRFWRTRLDMYIYTGVQRSNSFIMSRGILSKSSAACDVVSRAHQYVANQSSS